MADEDESDDEDSQEEDGDDVGNQAAWALGHDKLQLVVGSAEGLSGSPQALGPSMGGRVVALRAAACAEASTVLVGAADVWEWGRHQLPPAATGGGTAAGGSGVGATPRAAVVPRHPTRLAILSGRHITEVACGRHHTAALSAFDEVWVWGRNDKVSSSVSILPQKRLPAKLRSVTLLVLRTGCHSSVLIFLCASREIPGRVGRP